MTMSTWWTSLTEAEREQLKGDLARVLNPAIRADYDGEAEARDAYARWFVREHFLRKGYEQWRKPSYVTHYVDAYRQALAVKGSSAPIGPVSLGRNETVQHTFWIRWDDLNADKPPVVGEGHPRGTQPYVDAHWEEFQRWRTVGQEDQYWRWLIAEAEYHRVLNEALVRSYGVDVGAP